MRSDKERAYDRKSREKHREKRNKSQRDRHARLRAALLAMYGTCCSTCGETEEIVLTLDHIHGGGTKHRETRGDRGVYVDALKINDPTQYRILCANCQIRAYRGSV